MWIAYWNGQVAFWFENDTTYVAGREQDCCDIVITDDKSISREHASFRFGSRAPDDVDNPNPTPVAVMDKSRYGTSVIIPRAATSRTSNSQAEGGDAAAVLAAKQNSLMMMMRSDLPFSNIMTGGGAGATNSNNNNNSLMAQAHELHKLEAGQEWHVPNGLRTFGLLLGKHDAIIEFEWVPWIFPVAGESTSAADTLHLNQAACACGATLLRPGRGGNGLSPMDIAAALDGTAAQGVIVPQTLFPNPLVFAALCAGKPIVGAHVLQQFRERGNCKERPPDLADVSALPGHIGPEWNLLASAATSEAKQILLLSSNHNNSGNNSNRVSSMLGGASSSMLLLSVADGSVQVPREVFLPNAARRDLFAGLTFVTFQPIVHQQMSFFVPRSNGRSFTGASNNNDNNNNSVILDPLPVASKNGAAPSATQINQWLARHEGHLLVVASSEEQQRQQVAAVSPNAGAVQLTNQLPLFFSKGRASYAAKIPIIEYTDILCSILEARRIFDTRVALNQQQSKNNNSRGLLKEDADATDDSPSVTPARTQMSPAVKSNKSGQPQPQPQQHLSSPSAPLGGGGQRRKRDNDAINDKDSQRIVRPVGKEDELVGFQNDNNSNSKPPQFSMGKEVSMFDSKMFDSVPAAVVVSASLTANNNNNNNDNHDDDDDTCTTIPKSSVQPPMKMMSQRVMPQLTTFLPVLHEEGEDQPKPRNHDDDDIFAQANMQVSTIKSKTVGEQQQVVRVAMGKKRPEDDEPARDEDGAPIQGIQTIIDDNLLIVSGNGKRQQHQLPNFPCFWGEAGGGGGGGAQKKFRKQIIVRSNEPLEPMEGAGGGGNGGMQRLQPLGAAGAFMPRQPQRADADDLVPDDPMAHRPREFILFDDAGDMGGAVKRAKARGGAAAPAPVAKKATAKKTESAAAAKKSASKKKKTSTRVDDDDDDPFAMGAGSDDGENNEDDDDGENDDDDDDVEEIVPTKAPAAKRAPAKRAPAKKSASKASPSVSQSAPAKPMNIFDVDSFYD